MTQARTAVHPHTHHLRVPRTARYYTLGGEGGASSAIWFVLHGYGQLAGEFVCYFADLADPTSLIVAPEAMNRFYMVGVDTAPAADRPVGATWMTREDRDSEIADYVEYLDTLHEEILARPGHAAAAVTVIGFSQGAATATRWVTHSKARIDRLVLWGGLLPPETDLSPGAAALRHIPITYVIGSRDRYISDDMSVAEQARLEKAHVPSRLIRFDGGHAIRRTVFDQLRATD